MKIWGSLPWIGKKLMGGEEPIPRTPFPDFIDSMVVHLDIAASLLPDRWEDRMMGRFSSVAITDLFLRMHQAMNILKFWDIIVMMLQDGRELQQPVKRP